MRFGTWGIFSALFLFTTYANATTPALQYYQGVINIRGVEAQKTFCFSLDPTIIDEFEGDPDMQGHGFIHQEIPRFSENGGKTVCENRLELNGNYIKTCNGLYLISDRLEVVKRGAFGDVFPTLSRYNSDGSVKVKPIGDFLLIPVKSCTDNTTF